MNLHRTRQGFDLPSTRALPLNYCAILEQVEGIEPSNSAWKADVLPLNYTCIKGMKSMIHPFALKSILGINAFNKTYVFPAIVEKHFKTPLRYVESHANFSFFILDKSWCPVQNKVHLHCPYINSANSPFRVPTLILFG